MARRGQGPTGNRALSLARLRLPLDLGSFLSMFLDRRCHDFVRDHRLNSLRDFTLNVIAIPILFYEALHISANWVQNEQARLRDRR